MHTQDHESNLAPGARIIRLPEVERRTGRGRSSIYRDVKAGLFPKPRKIGQRAIGWLESEIGAWIEAR